MYVYTWPQDHIAINAANKPTGFRCEMTTVPVQSVYLLSGSHLLRQQRERSMEELILLSSLHLETGFGRRVEDFELNPRP